MQRIFMKRKAARRRLPEKTQQSLKERMHYVHAEYPESESQYRN